jgi:hypothetical protein
MFGSRSSIPLEILEGPDTLQGYLMDRYGTSIAGIFIQHGDYNITIGRRDNLTIEGGNVKDSDRLLPNTCLIMAIYWREEVRSCPDCDEKLSLSVGNWISW